MVSFAPPGLQEGAMYCNYCGKVIQDDANVCAYCGTGWVRFWPANA